MTTVAEWLENLKLERYAEAFEGAGYVDMPSVATLSETELDRIGITLPGHRNRILKNLPGGGAAAPSEDVPPPRPVAKPRPTPPGGATAAAPAVPAGDGGDDFGLNDVLGDLDSMMGDLDKFAAEMGTPAEPPKPPPKPVSLQDMLSSVGSSDLDAILADLCSFGTDSDVSATGTLAVEEEPPAPAFQMREMRPMNAQPMQLEPMNMGLRTVEMRPANLVPMNVTELKSMNITELKPMNVTELRPMNVTELTPMNASAPPPLVPRNVVEMRPMAAPAPAPVQYAEETFAAAELSTSPSSAVAPPRPKPFAGQSIRVGGNKTTQEIQEHLLNFQKRMSQAGQMTQTELEQMMKEEKIRIAMEKLAQASMAKCVLKIFIDEHTSKTMCIDTGMTARNVCNRLLVKTRAEDDPNWVVVEVCPELSIERTLEDHESIGDVHNMWPATACEYRFELRADENKYGLFVNPSKYFPEHIKSDLEETATLSDRTERAKRILFQEYFSSTSRIPDIKGNLQEREGKGKWKKRYFMLRASGLYYSTKGESEESKNLVCLVKLSDVDVCRVLDPKRTAKAPTDFCLAFRPRRRKAIITQNDLTFVSCDTEDEMNTWLAGIRLAYHGVKLKDNWEETQRKFTQLAEIGALDPSKSALVQSVRRKNVEETNKHLIRQWQSQRMSKKRPGVSAATGVMFDGMEEEEEGDGGEEDLESQRWYHGGIPREYADALFKDMSFQEGCFLVRASTSHPGDFVLSVCYQGKPHHFHVKKRGNPGASPQFSIDNGPLFLSLVELVENYRKKDERLPTVLKTEIPRQGALVSGTPGSSVSRQNSVQSDAPPPLPPKNM